MSGIKQIIFSAVFVFISLVVFTGETVQGDEPKEVLVILNNSNSPVIAGLNKHFTTITETEALSRLSTTANDLNKNISADSTVHEDIVEVLNNVAGIGIDGALLTADSFRDNPWLQAAKELHKPIVAENVEAAQMSSLTGCGFDSEAAVFRFESDRRVYINIIGAVANSQQEQGIVEIATEGASTITVPQGGSVITTTVMRDDEATVGISSEIPPEVLASQVSISLQQLNDEETIRQRAISPLDTSLPRRVSYACIMNYQPIRWNPVTGQEAFADVDFDISLYDTTSPLNKWLAISTSGPGISPSSTGAMNWDEETNRGYFMESFEIEFGPEVGGNLLNVDKFAPEAQNTEDRYTSTTGFSVGIEFGGEVGPSGPSGKASVKGSYNSAIARTTFIKDFSVKTFTQERGRWSFNLSKTGEGDPYESWESLKDGGLGPYIQKLPSLATGETMTPHNEVVWRTASDFQGIVPIDLTYKQTLRRVWSENFPNCGILAWCYKSNTGVFTQSKEILIDFSFVNFEGDLSISDQDITIDSDPSPGNFSTISANVQASLANYDNVVVDFYDGNPASSQSQLIATETITTLDQPYGVAKATWDLTNEAGWHDIWIVVNEQAGEVNTNNNIAWQRVNVTEAGETIPLKYKILLPFAIKR